MVRHAMNRWWGFVLTLCLFTVSFVLTGVSVPPAALAASSALLPEDTPEGGASCGDPDIPLGPGDGVSIWTWTDPGTVDCTVSVPEARPAGDVAASHSVAMNRLRLWLLGLRSFSLGF
jgi:hypothetical protein